MSGLRPGAAPFVQPPHVGGAAAAGSGSGDEDEPKLGSLAARFPSFPLPSLREVLAATGGDLASAEMLVSSMAGSARAAGAAVAAGERQRKVGLQPLPTAAAFPSLGGKAAAAPPPPPPPAALSLPPLRRKNEATTKTAILREEDFPALGAAAPAKPKHQQQRQQQQSEQQQLRASFAAAALSDPREAEAAARAATAAAAARAAAPAAAPASGRRQRRQDEPPSPTDSAVPWVSTGASVSAAYTGARERARALSVARNVHFEQSTRAYLQGDKASAKALGAEGRRLAAEMRAEHERAAALIFSSRNAGGTRGVASSPSSVSSDSTITMDLHGLHVAEGVAAVERAVERARENKSHIAASKPTTTKTTTLHLIVGVGKHTTHGAGRVARLPLAVKSKLDELEVEWEEGKVEGLVSAFV